MTEKRFQWIYIKDNTLELRDNGIVKVFNNERLEELLNDLAEENEQLKKDATTLIYSNREYRKENEYLKLENDGLKYVLENYKKIDVEVVLDD